MPVKNDQLPISVIIPVYNEAKIIEDLLLQLAQLNVARVIVVDAQSTDTTKEIAKKYNFHSIDSVVKNRSHQMNLGAEEALSNYLLFLHADVVLPKNFETVLSKAINQKVSLANFRLQFNWPHWFLKFNAFFTRFTWSCFQFGDQGLLVKRQLFEKLGGFNDQLVLAEGNEFIRRARKKSSFKKLDARLVVSARKYKKHGIYKLQLLYYFIYFLMRIGLRHERILRIYMLFLKQGNNSFESISTNEL